MSRDRLAAQQAELLRALLAGAPTPAGFDDDRLHAQAHALLAKRSRVTWHLRPDLADDLGDRFGPLFAEYAAAHPKSVGVRARQDADRFGLWLVEKGHLTPPRRPWWRVGRRP
ncbi:hypothetical protein ACFFS4_36780 [Kutzneria kofuensis]|uniref:SCO6045-like C-terminal domain-containing protein n=1 Tax=Kutzneria kofuensis TaxID=103725 RepID=A0A7W9KMJ6_9PSEU|nr:hypothetical protein [Kutzneria kofuensis]MBB5894589.1 hypothetical protein [Kutzneria kofuensis]